MKKFDVRKLTVSAMVCAIAFLAMFVFRFKVSFLTFDFKDAILSINALLYGPIMGVVSAALVAFIEFITVSDTGVYGLIMNFLSSAAFTLACGLVYKYKRDFSGAIIAVITSVFSVTAVMMLANVFITPYYMGVERSAVIAMLPKLLLPFNLSKAIMNTAFLLVIYKPFTTILKKTMLLAQNDKGNYKMGLKSVLLLVISVLVIILTTLFIILYLHGEFSIIRR